MVIKGREPLESVYLVERVIRINQKDVPRQSGGLRAVEGAGFELPAEMPFW